MYCICNHVFNKKFISHGCYILDVLCLQAKASSVNLKMWLVEMFLSKKLSSPGCCFLLVLCLQKMLSDSY
jgi:hypothetical protein